VVAVSPAYVDTTVQICFNERDKEREREEKRETKIKDRRALEEMLDARRFLLNRD
jgi:hypothetical protein